MKKKDAKSKKMQVFEDYAGDVDLFFANQKGKVLTPEIISEFMKDKSVASTRRKLILHGYNITDGIVTQGVK